jgi:hypothetical protein
MATLASTLTFPEVVGHYKPIRPVNVLFKSNWGNTVSLDGPSWRIVAFFAIADLENREPKVVPGLGELAASKRAADSLRAYLLPINESSLPFPRIVPATGGAILLVWSSGDRSLEIASFPDGEIVLEALDHGVLNEELSEKGLNHAIGWLIRG